MPLGILVNIWLETRALGTVDYCKVNEHAQGQIENACLFSNQHMVGMMSHSPSRENEAIEEKVTYKLNNPAVTTRAFLQA